MTTRWKPTRAGILNVWRYFDEVFTFHDGRLLLRGPNGSGKSKALELLLPFLFDANLQASRLSTFGQGARSMHWNLMGQGASGSTRVGYVWLELAQGDGPDVPHVTIGARLQASRSETRPRVDYFLADGRVGVELRLTEDQAPLTTAALREQLVGRGTVFATAGEYRAAVRQTLFPTMTADRYDTLVLALLQLRRPKLSEHLDPAALSSILSSALPPVDAGQIQELAEGFERLDQQRAHLVGLDDEVKAARTLQEQSRAYGRVVLRDRARAVTGATTRFDTSSRALRHGAERLEAARAAATAAHTVYDEAQRRLEALLGDRETLSRSEDYRSGEQLEELRRRVQDAERLADQSAADSAAEASRARLSAEHAAVLEADAAAALAERAGHEEALRTVATELGIEHLVDTSDDLRAHVAVRQHQVDDVVRLVVAHEDAVADRARSDERLSAATEGVAEAAGALQQEQAAVDRASAAYGDAVVAWAHDCRELRPNENDVQVSLRDEQVPALVAALLREHVARLAGERALLDKFRDEAIARRDVLVSERDDLETSGPVAPPVPRFRTAARNSAAGAPLWRLVDFRPGLSDDERAGLEAALEASGLLDAWVSPSGGLQVEGHDVVVSPSTPVDGATLADALTVDPAEAGPVADVVGPILSSIALGPDLAGPSWVSLDGRWRLGVAHGSWSKPDAQFVGATARERNRQARLAALAEQIVDAERVAADLVAQIAAVDEREAAARRDAEAVPADDAVRAGRRAVDHARSVLAERERAAAEARAERDAAQARVEDRARDLTLAADQSSLPTTRAALAAVRTLLVDTLRALEAFVRADRESAAAALRAADQRERAEIDASRADELAARALTTRSEALAMSERLGSLQERLGAGFERAAAQMREIETSITTTRADLPRRERAHTEAQKSVAALEERSTSAERAHQDAKEHRSSVSEDLVAVLRTSLAHDAGVAVDLAAEDRVRAVLEAARRIDRDVPVRDSETRSARPTACRSASTTPLRGSARARCWSSRRQTASSCPRP